MTMRATMIDGDLERFAEIFHRAFRKEQDLAPPWSGASETHKKAIKAGLMAVWSTFGEKADNNG